MIGRKTIWKTIFFLFLCFGTFWILKQNQNFKYYTSAGEVFGTTYHIKYKYNQQLSRKIQKELQKVDNSLSVYNPQSVISKINKNEGVALTDMFIHVFKKANEISKKTNGAFDITVAPLVNAWGFGFKNSENITKEKVDSIMQFVGFDKIKLEKGRIIKNDRKTMLDCNAIAKGYSVDVIAAFMQRHQIKNYMIEIGGEIIVEGLNSKGKIWKIGIDKPIDDSTTQKNVIQTIINISSTAMATSGNYRNYYYKENKKIAHTINPKTGYPCQSDILSATVFANDCCTADAYATAFMVMGSKKAKDFLSAHHNLKAIFILSDEDGNFIIWNSPSLKNKM